MLRETAWEQGSWKPRKGEGAAANSIVPDKALSHTQHQGYGPFLPHPSAENEKARWQKKKRPSSPDHLGAGYMEYSNFTLNM